MVPFSKKLKKILNEIKEVSNCPIGFHPHDNLELAFSNTLTSIENGIDIVFFNTRNGKRSWKLKN